MSHHRPNSRAKAGAPMTDVTSSDELWSPSFLRKRDPILSVLTDVLPDRHLSRGRSRYNLKSNLRSQRGRQHLADPLPVDHGSLGPFGSGASLDHTHRRTFLGRGQGRRDLKRVLEVQTFQGFN
jgi:hypothetical protein